MQDNPLKDAKELTDSLQKLATTVPVYQDAVQPAAKQVGQALDTVGAFVNLILKPLKDGVYIGDKLLDRVAKSVEAKLAIIPQERLQVPDIIIAGPIFEALRYAASNDLLMDLYTSLLASSMDSKTAHRAHPGFVEVLKNLSPDEARILKYLVGGHEAIPVLELRLFRPDIPDGGFKTVVRYFTPLTKKASCVHGDLAESYIDNLIRLGILEIPEGLVIAQKDAYKELEEAGYIKSYKERLISIENARLEIERKMINITSFGQQLIDACVTLDEPPESEWVVVEH